MNNEYLAGEFKRIYGPQKGMQIYGKVMPCIVADFMKILNKAEPDKRMEEEYRLDDQKTVVWLFGKKKKDGLAEIEALIRTNE